MDVSVIIVSYNGRSALERCLESLKANTVFQYTEVIVVDNASSDGTPQMIRDRYPWVELYEGSENIGFSRGVNVGIQAARGKYFLILNPDTVLRKDAIEELGAFMENTPDAGIAGPKLVFQDGNLQYSCRRFYNWRVLLLRRTILGKIFKNSKAVSDHLMLDFDHSSTRDVDWILGACMFVRREAVESVGPMDERFFLYFEDVDWCYRMRQKGWKVYYHPHAVVVHNYGRDSAHSVINRSFVAHLASLVRYYEKWNFVWYFIKKHRAVLKTIVFLVVDVIAFNLAFLSAYYLRGFLDNIFPNPIFPISAYERFVVFENLLFAFTYFALGLYKIRRETKGVDEFFDITRAIVLASVLLMASTYLGQIRTYSRMVVAFLVPFAIMYDWSFRQLIRRTHRKLLKQKIDLKRVGIVGTPERANELEKRLMADPALGVEVVGIVDSGSGKGPGGTWEGLAELNAMVDRYRIQEVIFVPGAVSDEQVADFVTTARRRVLDVTVVADYAGMVIHQAEVTDLAGRPAIAYRRDTRYVVDRLAKRLL
ncbi:MAG: glycosyltransferase, partial [bacterium]|nr:glycosyltransferase [bacterium]